MSTVKTYTNLEIRFFLENTGDFEMIVSMLIGETERKTNIRSRNVDDFETYINATEIDYVIKDIIFTRRLTKLNTP